MDPINPSKTLVEQTYDTLLDAICAGEFQPGERLNQDEIAARLNCSESAAKKRGQRAVGRLGQ